MKKIKANKFIYSVLALLFTTLLSANTVTTSTYYISPTGNDNASGTSASTPWQSISKINNLNIAPGTTILFQGGQTFQGTINLNNLDANDPANKVVLSSYGGGKAIINSGAAMGLYAYNTKGFTVSDLIFQGAGMSANNTDGIMLYTDLPGDVKLEGITLKNVDVHNYGKVGISVGSGYNNTGFKDLLLDAVHVYDVKQNGITTWGITSQSHTGWAHYNVTIQKSLIHNVPGFADASQHKGSGIILGQTDKGLIENTVAHHTGSANIHCGGPGGIWTWDSNNITIQFCESYSNSSGTGCDGLGFDLDGGVTNSLMQYNYSHDNDGAGYLLGQYDNARPWSNNVVRYNISENDGKTNAGGITLFKGAGTTMNGVKIYNNTVYTSPAAANPAIAAFKILQWNTGITGAEVYNNIFQTTGGAALVDIPSGYSAYFAGNLYWSTGGAFKIKYQGTTYSNLAAWRTATGNEKSGSLTTGIVADPMLMGAGSGITVYPNATSQLSSYKFAGASPAIDAGLNLATLFSINAGPRDYFGNAAPFGAATDIGACEHHSGVSTGISTGALTDGIESVIDIFPNPVKIGDQLNVKVTGAKGPYSIEVISLTGAVVWKQTKIEAPVYRIPTLNVASAIYLISVTEDDGKKQTVKKIMLE